MSGPRKGTPQSSAMEAKPSLLHLGASVLRAEPPSSALQGEAQFVGGLGLHSQPLDLKPGLSPFERVALPFSESHQQAPKMDPNSGPVSPTFSPFGKHFIAFSNTKAQTGTSKITISFLSTQPCGSLRKDAAHAETTTATYCAGNKPNFRHSGGL